MSGGIAYVFDEDGTFADLVNPAQVELERIVADANEEEGAGYPRQRPQSVHDFGLGDMLRHDADRLKILIERHKLHTGSSRAAAILEDWDASLAKFVKVMPTDYRHALTTLENERNEAASEAAE